MTWARAALAVIGFTSGARSAGNRAAVGLQVPLGEDLPLTGVV
jgi:hypothetical protein